MTHTIVLGYCYTTTHHHYILTVYEVRYQTRALECAHQPLESRRGRVHEGVKVACRTRSSSVSVEHPYSVSVVSLYRICTTSWCNALKARDGVERQTPLYNSSSSGGRWNCSDTLHVYILRNNEDIDVFASVTCVHNAQRT